MNYDRTYCNPISIPDYPQGSDVNGFSNCRELADPTVIYHDEKWYLYATHGTAYETSDFTHWTECGKIGVPRLSAPTVAEYENKFYLIGSNSPLYAADNPWGPFIELSMISLPGGRMLSVRDPMIFVDDTQRVYLYWGLGADGIYGLELDSQDLTKAITYPKWLFGFNPEHPWERLGDWNQNAGNSFIEGSWMIKNKGRYYLVYSAPGTCYRTYAFGAYCSDTPLDGFAYKESSPFFLNRHGLLTGTGHGCFVKGPNDTLWAFYTIALCHAHKYERRIGFDPAGIDENGNLFISGASETPQWAPGVTEHPEKNNNTNLLPLTFAEPVFASSCAPGRDAVYATDESLLSWWQPAAKDLEPNLIVELRACYAISAVRIIWRDVNLDYANGILPGPFRYKIKVSNENNPDNFVTVLDMSDNSVDYVIDYQTFETVNARFVQLVITGKPLGIEPGVINFTAFGTYHSI